MGCDIHMWAEVRKRDGWEKVGAIFDDPYHRKDDPESDPKTDHPYDNRNYDLYAILSDVRNGRGFAGIETGDGFLPISKPRGFPEDVSPEIKKDKEECCLLNHSASWLLLSEILEYNWNLMTHKTGYVDEGGFLCFLENGGPEGYGYSIDVGGPGMLKITNQQMKDRLNTEQWRQKKQLLTEYEKLKKETSDAWKEHGATSNQYLVREHRRREFWRANLEQFPCYYTKVRWPKKYYDVAGKDWWDAIDKLQRLLPYDKRDIRLVFYFDN